jgi:hypothetical protein
VGRSAFPHLTARPLERTSLNLFGRGNWAIVGLAKESLDAFKTNLEDRLRMIAVSQLAASSITRHTNTDALGINPFGSPRLDEQQAVAPDQAQILVQFATADEDKRSDITLPPELIEHEGYAFGLAQFQLHETVPWFGLWAVANQWKDISDLASIKEQHSYAVLDRPYKFLQATDRKTVDKDTRGATAAVRKQFAVLLDFNEGRVYIENSNKKTIYLLKELLRQLGADIIAVGWNYNRPHWPSAILGHMYESSHYLNDFQKRADETTRFRPKEIEKLEDTELEKIVSNYFSMSQLSTDMWVGITTPALIRLHHTSQPIAVKAPASATTLLGVTQDAQVFSGSITFQDRITAMSKKGGEITFRKDLLSLQINDQINLVDAGAAMLRGFDLPAFKKDIQREIKHTKQVPTIDQFWSQWLHEMSNAVRIIESCFREILGLDAAEPGGILPMRAPTEEEEEPEELAVAQSA